MRLVADVPEHAGGVKRLMIYEDATGVYLFGFDQVPDGGGLFDEWYETIDDAKEAATESYHVSSVAWTQIADPAEHCQHDWIQQVRVKGRDVGKPKWGQLERLVNGRWEDFQG